MRVCNEGTLRLQSVYSLSTRAYACASAAPGGGPPAQLNAVPRAGQRYAWRCWLGVGVAMLHPLVEVLGVYLLTFSVASTSTGMKSHVLESLP